MFSTKVTKVIGPIALIALLTSWGRDVWAKQVCYFGECSEDGSDPTAPAGPPRPAPEGREWSVFPGKYEGSIHCGSSDSDIWTPGPERLEVKITSIDDNTYSVQISFDLEQPKCDCFETDWEEARWENWPNGTPIYGFTETIWTTGALIYPSGKHARIEFQGKHARIEFHMPRSLLDNARQQKHLWTFRIGHKTADGRCAVNRGIFLWGDWDKLENNRR
jgi:hypothetical protein